MESWLKPMLAKPVDVVPEGDGWALEGKLDGWRCVTRTSPAGGTHVYGGRNGSEYTGKLPYLEAALGEFPADTALDGELIAGQWGDVQGVMTRGNGPHVPSEAIPALTYVVFDVLRLNGTDARSNTYDERRELLEHMAGPGGFFDFDRILLVPNGPSTAAAHEKLLDLGMEGSVCKLRSSRYQSGTRSPAWVKIKPQETTEARIVGFKAGEKGGQFDGKVGAFEVVLLDTGQPTTVKCGTNARHDDATDHPELWRDAIIEIKHHGWQESGKVRHPQFLRRRDDRSADEAVPAPTPRRASTASSRPARRSGASGRAYHAMKQPKLGKCIRELEQQSGDAYDRCIAKGGDPAADLAAARAAAA